MSLALHAVRGLRQRPDDADPTAGLSDADEAKVESGAPAS
jgi:hypothetical protein